MDRLNIAKKTRNPNSPLITDGSTTALFATEVNAIVNKINELVELSGGTGESGLTLGESASTAYAGDKGKIAYEHSQSLHAPTDAEKNINSDWEALSGDSQILNKPIILTNEDVLLKNNTSSFTPTSNYHPATKKYVDDVVIGVSGGDMLKSVYDPNNDGKVNLSVNADTVNNLTVLASVPSNAVFTDTVYVHPSTHPASIINQDSTHRFVTDVEKALWNAGGGGIGDMTKAIYDTTDNGIVDNSEKLGGINASNYSQTSHNHTLLGLTEKSYNSLTDKPNIPSISGLATVAYVDSEISALGVIDTTSNIKKYKIVVKVPTGTDTSGITMAVAPLKYNKEWCWTFTADDSFNGIYGIWQRFVNNRYVNKLEQFSPFGNLVDYWYHDDTDSPYRTVENSTYSGKYIGYTDGCGNRIPLRFAQAIIPSDVSLTGGTLDPATSLPELITFNDFKGGIYIHEYGGGQNDVFQSIRQSLDYAKFNFGRYPTCIARPNGDNKYLEAMGSFNELKSGVNESGAYVIYQPIDLNLKLDNLNLKELMFVRSFSDTTPAEFKASTISGIHSGAFIQYGTHTVYASSYPTMCQDYFTWLNDTYGADGTDVMWGATIDEVWDYEYLKQNTTITRTTSSVVDDPGATAGDKVIFEIEVSDENFIRFKELSFLINGVQLTNDIRIYGGTITESIGNNSTNVLWNIGWDEDEIVLAEKYTTIAESKIEDEYLSDFIGDANFFINRLKTSLRTPYTNRINALADIPTLSSILINSGDAATSNDTVSISLNFTGIGTYYKISENLDTLDASAPISFTGSPFNYTFSNTNVETKTVYVKLGNLFGYSESSSDTINYLGPILSLDSISINNGDSTTQTNAISLAINVINTTPTHYAINETNDFTTPSWVVWTGSPVDYTFTNVSGTKTLYAIVKDAVTTTTSKNDSIVYTPITLSTVVINSGATNTTNLVASVAFTYTGVTPTHYAISEINDFSSPTWITYGSPVSFTMSGGNGTKTIYAILKDAANNISNVVSDSIIYTAETSGIVALVSMIGGSNDTIMNQLGDGRWYNQIYPRQFENGNNFVIKNTDNVSFGTYITKPSLLAVDMLTFGDSTGYDPILTGNTGTYPDALINKARVLIPWEHTNLTDRCGMRFTVTNGTYTIRILGSTQSDTIPSEQIYFVNGAQLSPASSLQNASDTWITFSNVVVSNTFIDIYVKRNTNINALVPINFIEFTKTV